MVGAVFDGCQESDAGSRDIYKQHADLERNTQSSVGSPDCLFCSFVLEIVVAFFPSGPTSHRVLNKPSRSGGAGGDSGGTGGDSGAAAGDTQTR